MTERVLVDGYTFLVTDETFEPGPTGGLFHRDTRYLSGLSVSLADAALHPVGSHLVRPWRRVVKYADLPTSVNRVADAGEQKHTSVVLTRDQVVVEGLGLVERVTVENASGEPRDLRLRVGVEVGFEDLFEIRDLDADIDREVAHDAEGGWLTFEYHDPALSDGPRRVDVATDPRPTTLGREGGTVPLSLAPQGAATVTLAAVPGGTDHPIDASLFEQAVSAAGGPPVVGTERDPGGTLPDSPYADVFAQAARDLRALVTETAHGPVALAGVPWFATVFGRDALITAYNLLHVEPTLAVGTLRYLAAHQGTGHDDYREERAGKIFHEMRRGELVERGHIPHDPYYGSVDATPLWVVLLDETARWTGDDDLVTELWDHATAAATWLTRAVDRVGDDPFLYYTAAGDDGVAHKAWRDTEGSVQFADGEAATPPLASVEVQGYAYDAFARLARLARDQGDREAAQAYERRARAIEARFHDAFWLEGEGYYGAARTAGGRVVDSKTSNVGHCLWSGLVPEDRADAVVETLLSDPLNSGWGVRTMSRDSAGYSPVSYHVGSVWPHDNALIALGTCAYGYREATEELAGGVLEACRSFDDDRVPELYCGFDDDHPPYRYPAACEPQAWGASTPFALLRALFDVRPTAGGAELRRVPRSVPIGAEAAAALCEADVAESAGDERHSERTRGGDTGGHRRHGGDRR